MALPRMIADLSEPILSNDILKRIQLISAIAGIDIYISVSLVPFLCLLLHEDHLLGFLAILTFLR
jgi:hypothetical protein